MPFSSFLSQSIIFKQFLEQGSVMDHRFPQVFRTGLSAVVPEGDIVGRSVILNNDGMVNRYVSGALFEVTDGIASRLHNLHHEAVRHRYSTFGIINKTSLHFVPTLFKAGAVHWAQRSKFKALSALLPKFENTLALANVSLVADHPVVLGPKTFSQHETTASTHCEISGYCDDNKCDNHDDNHELIAIHACLLRATAFV
jgi:hypothetical protein